MWGTNHNLKCLLSQARVRTIFILAPQRLDDQIEQCNGQSEISTLLRGIPRLGVKPPLIMDLKNSIILLLLISDWR